MSQGAPLTILFTDVEGSTDLRTRLGDAAAHRILRSHEEILRSCVIEHDGREVKALGDGFMVVFSSVRRALACAQAIQRNLLGEEVRVRIGINTGEVVVEGDDLYGQAVNAAARIAGRAQGGEIVVSDIVRQLAGSGPEFSFRDRGSVRLKGFPERWRLHALVCGDAGPAGSPAFPDRTPFIGREAERVELRRLLDRAAAAEGGLVLIGGEPGVGKSRLTAELAAEAAPRFCVLVGHCYESGRMLPYMPWVELVEATVTATDPEQLWEVLGDEAPELARLVPELRRRLPDIPPPVDLPPEQQRRYTFNSIRDHLERVSQTQPRLLILEDLHWADEPTLLLLEHLAERLAGMPCLVVGTHRDAPDDVTPALAATVGNLVRRRQAVRMSLARHSEQEVGALLRALSRRTPPEAVRAAVYGETDGNAFFVEEVFRHLAEGGRLLDEAGQFRTDLPIDELDVPANVRLVIDRRLERLDEATHHALSVGAVAGRRLSFELWEAIADHHGDDLIDVLDDAERAGLIVTQAIGAQEEYWFAHELVRHTLLTRLPAARRRRYHLRVANAIERLSPDASAEAGTIAAHLIEAGSAAEPLRLFRYLVLAARRSIVSAAFEDALRHFRRAVSVADHATTSEQAEMLVDLGMAERGAGRAEEAVHAWQRALVLYEREGDTAAIARTCAMAAWNLAGGGRLLDGYQLAQRGLSALGNERSAHRGRLLVVSGFSIAGAGRYQDGMANITEALALAEDLGDRGLSGSALGWKAALHHMHMEIREAVDAGARSADILRATGDVGELAIVLAAATLSSVGAGSFGDVRRLAAQGRPLAERLGNHTAVMMCDRALAMVNWAETADLDALEAFTQRDMQMCTETEQPWISWSWSWLAVAAFYRGDWKAALAHSQQAAALSPPTVVNGAEWALHLEYCAYEGRRQEALAMISARKSELPGLGERCGWGRWAILWGALESLVVLGEREAAAELYPLVRWCTECTGSMMVMQPDCRLLERGAGMASAAGADWDVAEAHFIAALQQAETLPHRPEQAHTRRFYAAMLLERDRPGDRDAAALLLGEARDLYRGMEMPRHCRLVDDLLDAS